MLVFLAIAKGLVISLGSLSSYLFQFSSGFSFLCWLFVRFISLFMVYCVIHLRSYLDFYREGGASENTSTIFRVQAQISLFKL